MTKVYAIHTTSYDLAREVVKCCDFEDFAPFAVHLTLDGAKTAIMAVINVERAEEREFEEDMLPGMTDFPDVKVEQFDFIEFHAFSGKTMQWKTEDKLSENCYVITELELGS